MKVDNARPLIVNTRQWVIQDLKILRVLHCVDFSANLPTIAK